MPGLHELQRGFSKYIVDQSETDFVQDIDPNGITGPRRLNVYRNNVFSSLTEALRAVYPATEMIVGKDFFKQTARHFITNYPSASGDLHDYGKDFPAFLQAMPELEHLGYLPDVAQLEWHYHEVFHATDASAVSLQEIQMALQNVTQAEYGQLRFQAHPATRLLQSRFPIVDIWTFASGDKNQRVQKSLNLEPGDYYFAVTRRNLKMAFQTLDVGEYTFLMLLSQKNTLADIELKLCQDNGNFDLQQCLIKNISLGNITGFIN